MSPLDGLKRILPKNNKVYRPSSRINFLINQPPVASDPIEQQNTIEEKPGILTRPKFRFDKNSNYSEKKYTIAKIILITSLIIIISGVMYLSEKLFSPSGGNIAGLAKFNPFAQLAYLITSSDKRVDGELQDRINLLALGVGGEGHDGPYLTDTIIIISLKPSTGEVGLLSIPRDMVIKLKDGQWPKINSIYALGRSQNKDQAARYFIQTLENNFDLPIHYFGLVTFDGFEKFIDEIGGINVNVPVAFTDNLYPTDDYKTHTVSFTAGEQTMDGKTALIFARSRHGNNFEGSDFARSRRQQLILQAVKDKLFKFSTLLSPTKLSAIKELLGSSLETNLSVWQALKISQMLKNTDESKIYRLTLDDAPDSILEPGFSSDGAWILQPKDGNFDSLSRQFKNIFNTGKIKEEAAKIAIQNGTPQDGLAYWTTVALEKLGYKIVKYGNAATQDYERTVIYDLTNGQKNNSLKWLKAELNAYVAKSLPQDLPASTQAEINANNTNTAAIDDGKTPDFLIILGTDYADSFKLPEEKPVITTTSTPQLATSTAPLAQ
ncbi:MAG: LCP family protein [Patescibacteria group bacterium]|jgi:LCP family protein required for cell wall assembly